jgi:glycosyltransferase involved in cell wall biosynthesis
MPNTPLSNPSVPQVTLTSNLFFPHIGGVENSLLYLAKAYAELGYRATVLSSDIPRAGQPRLPTHDTVKGVQVERYQTGRSGLLPSVLRSFVSAFKLYRQQRIQQSDSFMVCRYHYNQLLASLAGVRPTVYLVPGVIKFQNAPKFQHRVTLKYRLRWHYHHLLQKWALQRATHVAVFSENMAEQVRQIGYSGPIHMTKPGVDLQRFAPLTRAEKMQLREQQELAKVTDSHVFLCVGRCVGVKGFHLAVEAMSSLPANAELWIIGDGTEKQSLEQLAERLGVAERVSFFGAVHDTERFYALADTFVHTSLYEPLGQTVLEALASGLAMVALEPNKAAGVNTASRDLMADEHCRFVAEANAEALAEQMQQCIELSATAYAEQSRLNRQYAEQKFSWLTLAKDLKAIATPPTAASSEPRAD